MKLSNSDGEAIAATDNVIGLQLRGWAGVL